MRYDEALIDEAVLAVLYLTAWEEHGLTRAWKGIGRRRIGSMNSASSTTRRARASPLSLPRRGSLVRAPLRKDSSPRGRVNDHAGLLSNPRLERAVRRVLIARHRAAAQPHR